jgi:ABC-type transport system involved in cytochrome c biogenesis ATPase subunit
MAPLRRTFKIPIGFRKTTRAEHLYLFLKNLEQVRSLASHYRADPSTGTSIDQQEFFKALESTYISELISEVRITVKTRKSDDSLTFGELSEGEQQLLMVLGLLRFTREQESLFLLDEPDTHLNPAWGVQYIDFLTEIGGADESSHIIMATHDPLVVSGLDREHVRVLTRDYDTGRVTCIRPREDPWKMGVAALLTSDLYGLEGALGMRGIKLLRRKRELAAKQKLNKSQREELAHLTDELGQIDYATISRDPLYPLFAEQMAKRQHAAGLESPVLRPDEYEELRELASEVFSELEAGDD